VAHPYQSIRASLGWTFIWIISALIFNFLIWLYLYVEADTAIANQKALEFFTGYLIEKSLSIDNLFIFYIIFQHFHIPIAFQQRVLSYGIWGAIVMRLLLILLGVWLVSRFHWLLYIMGAFLLLTGVKLLLFKEKKKDLSETMLIRLCNRLMRVSPLIEGNRFFIKKNAVLYATPLFVSLIFIEFSDLIFAFDSIPAIFAITRDPFIIWTSNVFAILGLRALYFLLANMVERFTLLKSGIAVVLMFVGFKMLIEPWYLIPVGVSLTIVAGILIIFLYLSLMLTKQQKENSNAGD